MANGEGLLGLVQPIHLLKFKPINKGNRPSPRNHFPILPSSVLPAFLSILQRPDHHAPNAAPLYNRSSFPTPAVKRNPKH